jgi:hypothetical protein
MANGPNLPLEVLASIERAREQILLHAQVTWRMLFLPEWGLLKDPSPKTPKPASLKLELQQYSLALFDAEAQHYLKYAKDEAELRSWLQPVAARVGDEVARDAFDSSQDVHCSEAERRKAISDALIKRVDHWVGQKQSEIISRASGPQREEAAPSPIRSGSGVRPTHEEEETKRTDDLEIPSDIRTEATAEEPPFPHRAAWLKDRLRERGWDHNDPWRHSGPDRKTVLKILAGKQVRADMLEKLAIALSSKRQKVDLIDIPNS